jgi:hypothetical protein
MVKIISEAWLWFKTLTLLAVVSVALMLLPFLLMFVLGLMGFATGIGLVDSAKAHSWYPIECCHQLDCGPVLSMRQTPAGLEVTSTHGTAVVPQTMAPRKSQDHQAHVCIRPGENGALKVICYFEQPSF